MKQKTHVCSPLVQNVATPPLSGIQPRFTNVRITYSPPIQFLFVCPARYRLNTRERARDLEQRVVPKPAHEDYAKSGSEARVPFAVPREWVTTNMIKGSLVWKLGDLW
jgi:hypothetical protein